MCFFFRSNGNMKFMCFAKVNSVIEGENFQNTSQILCSMSNRFPYFVKLQFYTQTMIPLFNLTPVIKWITECTELELTMGGKSVSGYLAPPPVVQYYHNLHLHLLRLSSSSMKDLFQINPKPRPRTRHTYLSLHLPKPPPRDQFFVVEITKQ